MSIIMYNNTIKNMSAQHLFSLSDPRATSQIYRTNQNQRCELLLLIFKLIRLSSNFRFMKLPVCPYVVLFNDILIYNV